MTTFSKTVGTPTYPIGLNISADINVSMSVSSTIIESAAEGSEVFLATLQNCVNAAENAYKTLPDFRVQDSSRNGTATYTSKGNFVYDIVVSFSIENATVALSTSTSTDLQGSDLENLLQTLADNKVSDFKAAWGFVDLV